MRTVEVNGLEIGAGKPKIAVPLVEATTGALVSACLLYTSDAADD